MARRMDWSGVRILLGATALRISLVLLGALDLLQWRVEVSTPANSLHSVREGLALLQMHVSPYSGSQCRAPPLVLWLHQHTAAHHWLYALPNVVLDMAAGLLLRDITGRVLPTGMISRNSVMAMYLLNPLTMAACLAGTTSSLECWAVILAIWLAVKRSWVGTALALAAASYLDLHWPLLVVPLTLLLVYGPEPCRPQSAAGKTSDTNQQSKDQTNSSSESSTQQQGSAGITQSSLGPSRPVSLLASSQPGVMLVVRSTFALALMTGLAWLCLATLSNGLVQHLPGAACNLPPLPSFLSRLLQEVEDAGIQAPLAHSHAVAPKQHADSNSTSGSQQSTVNAGLVQVDGRCWASAAYGLHFIIEDQTPNMGQTWYFFTEMFKQYLGLFRFVVHSLSAVLLVPMAVRFPRRPLLLITVQCLITCMFKPYPSVGEHALYLALLPLLQPQLRRLNSGMLLVVSCLLLAVLEPSMWHMWINIESANSNFYYSISLLLGAWQTLLLVQLLLLSIVDAEAVKASQANRY